MMNTTVMCTCQYFILIVLIFTETLIWTEVLGGVVCLFNMKFINFVCWVQVNIIFAKIVRFDKLTQMCHNDLIPSITISYDIHSQLNNSVLWIIVYKQCILWIWTTTDRSKIFSPVGKYRWQNSTRNVIVAEMMTIRWCLIACFLSL